MIKLVLKFSHLVIENCLEIRNLKLEIVSQWASWQMI